MNLRSDHVAGVAFIAFGILVISLSGDLPFGRLSMPGAGFMPDLIAALLIVLGLALALRARESAPLADIDWGDARHAILVIVITGAAIALYTWLGFIITMVAMMMGLLLLVEHRKIAIAGVYSLFVVVITFILFDRGLQALLPAGPFGF